MFRYIRLTYLIPELPDKVDEGIIALSPVLELSCLSKEQQNTLSSDSIYEIMSIEIESPQSI